MPNERISDRDAMTKIAALLGTNEEWDSAADYLERIAGIVEWTGRQHPGDADPKTYQAERDDDLEDPEVITTTVSTIRQNYLEGISQGQEMILEMLEVIAAKNYTGGDYEVFYGVTAALEMIHKKLNKEPKNV